MDAKKLPIGRLAKAFCFSVAGYVAAFKDEAAFRQVLLLSLVLAIVACVLPLDALTRTILLIPLGISIIVELFNSAIENVVDLASPEINPLAKKAKDMGSAAQLTALLLIVVVWVIILAGKFL